MRTRTEFYLRKDFGFIDLGLAGLLDRSTRDVYDVLRRFVWRSSERGHPKVRELLAAGRLSTLISQHTLGEYTGLSRRAISEHIAVLKRWGWIKTVETGDHAALIYILGEYLEDSQGGRHETFYADVDLTALWDTLDREAKDCEGPEATILSAFTIEQRVEMSRAWLEKRGILPVRTEERTPHAPESGGGAHSGAEGVRTEERTPHAPGFSHKNRRSEVEKPEEAKGETTRPSPGVDSDPFGGFGDALESRTTPRVRATRSPRRTENASFDDVLGPPREEPKVRSTVAQGAPAAGGGPALPRLAVPALGAPAGPFARTVEAPLTPEESIALRKQSLMQTASAAIQQESARDGRKANLGGKLTKPQHRAQVMELAQRWRSTHEQHHTTKLPPWDERGKEYKQLEGLLAKYGPQLSALGVEYALKHWDRIRPRLFKTSGSVPTLGLVVVAHEVLFSEAQQYADAVRVVNEYRAQLDADIYSGTPEQHAAYEKASKTLKLLGFES